MLDDGVGMRNSSGLLCLRGWLVFISFHFSWVMGFGGGAGGMTVLEIDLVLIDPIKSSTKLV